MNLGGLTIWRKAVSFHCTNWKTLLPVFPLLCIPILGDVLHTLLIAQGRQNKSISPKKAIREVWGLLPSLFASKLYFECAALLWALVPIYGIIQGVRHRQHWAMASNVLVFEGLSGKAGHDRCREIVNNHTGGIGVRTLVTIPSLLLTGLLLAWVIVGSIFEQTYSYGFWCLIAATYWVAVPLSGAVNTFLYLSVLPDSQKTNVSLSLQTETVVVRSRGGWIWVISVYYMILSTFAVAAYFMPQDLAELSPAELVYEESGSTFELILDHFLIPLCYFAGGISLLLLRKSAFFLFAVGLTVNTLHIAWEIYARGVLQVYSGGLQIFILISLVIDLIICTYTWKLIKKGVLQ